MAVLLLDSGYINNQLSLNWLHYFNQYIRKTTVGTKQLLFLNGYGSHHTLEFINYCNKNGIILFAFLPYITHILQPLNIVVF